MIIIIIVIIINHINCVSVVDNAAQTAPHIIREPDADAAREKAYKDGEDVRMVCIADEASEAVLVHFVIVLLVFSALGVFIVRSCKFKCSFDNAKRSFFGSVNALFSKLGRSASEDVFLHLVDSKCLHILLYCLEVCPLTKSDLRSLDFTVTRLLMKLFRTPTEI